MISGPDPEPYVAAIRRAVGAGYRTVYLHQVGPDQAGFLDFSERVLRPAFAHVTALDPGSRSPSLENLRLLSDGRSAALLGSDAEVRWWCRPRFDSPPICWSLLDPRGGSARWLEATHAGSDGEPAGTTARTRLRIGFAGRVEVWDGLVPTGGRHSDLVRLVRALDDDVEVWHALKLGGFSEPWATWVDGAATFDGLAAGRGARGHEHVRCRRHRPHAAARGDT